MDMTPLLLTRQEIEEKLKQVFTPEQVASMLEVLDSYRLSVGRLEAAIEKLIEAQARTEKRMEELAQALTHLAQRVERIQTDISDLKADVSTLKTDVSALKTEVATLKGSDLERKYRRRAEAYFGKLLRRPRALAPDEMDDAMYAEIEARLTLDELNDLFHLDLFVWGRPKSQPDAPPVWLVIEVSSVIDSHDVERAQRRADTLRKAGYRAIPTVAGEQITTGAEEKASAGNVLLVRDGNVQFWDEALKAAL